MNSNENIRFGINIFIDKNVNSEFIKILQKPQQN